MGQLFRKDSEETDVDIKYFDFEVSLEENTLDQYENMMSRYREWKNFKRDIRLTGLLEDGKRIQFDIEDISMLVPIGCEEIIVSIQLSTLEIKSMSFILKEDRVEKLTLKCKTLETPMGKVVRDLMDGCFLIEIRQKIVNGKINYFYVDTNEKVAA
jgi:hypothetical protein